MKALWQSLYGHKVTINNSRLSGFFIRKVFWYLLYGRHPPPPRRMGGGGVGVGGGVGGGCKDRHII